MSKAPGTSKRIRTAKRIWHIEQSITKAMYDARNERQDEAYEELELVRAQLQRLRARLDNQERQ